MPTASEIIVDEARLVVARYLLGDPTTNADNAADALLRLEGNISEAEFEILGERVDRLMSFEMMLELGLGGGRGGHSIPLGGRHPLSPCGAGCTLFPDISGASIAQINDTDHEAHSEGDESEIAASSTRRSYTAAELRAYLDELLNSVFPPSTVAEIEEATATNAGKGKKRKNKKKNKKGKATVAAEVVAPTISVPVNDASAATVAQPSSAPASAAGKNKHKHKGKGKVATPAAGAGRAGVSDTTKTTANAHKANGGAATGNGTTNKTETKPGANKSTQAEEANLRTWPVAKSATTAAPTSMGIRMTDIEAGPSNYYMRAQTRAQH